MLFLGIKKDLIMKFTVDKQENYIVIELQEEKLNSLTGPKLKSELVLINAEGFRSMVIDLSHVQFIDSSGLSAILVGNRLCKESGGSFVICSLNEQALKLIRISQLEGILNIVPTVSEASDLVKMEELERELKQ
jgi:anti-sigma B factor antagonist